MIRILAACIIAVSATYALPALAGCDERWATCMSGAQDQLKACAKEEEPRCQSSCSAQCKGRKAQDQCVRDCVKICRGTNRCQSAFNSFAAACRSQRADCQAKEKAPKTSTEVPQGKGPARVVR
ncbi:MAG TPA: hypothetical protein VFA20_32835 [Myxococcaceae bacterium]|nr:hypothetical protein [Myxococcaceae bacterium]